MSLINSDKLNPVIWDYMTNLTEKERLQNKEVDGQMEFGHDPEEAKKANSKFANLIEDYKLQNWENELEVFRLYLHRTFPFNTITYDFSLCGADLKTYSKEVEQLKAFNNGNGLSALNQIDFISPKGVLKIKHPKLLEELRASLNNLSAQIEALSIPEDPYPEIKYITSHGKSYTENFLFPFYRFIAAEVLPDQTKKCRYKFIADFTYTINLEWSLIRKEAGQLLEDYLENIFKKLA